MTLTAKTQWSIWVSALKLWLKTLSKKLKKSLSFSKYIMRWPKRMSSRFSELFHLCFVYKIESFSFSQDNSKSINSPMTKSKTYAWIQEVFLELKLVTSLVYSIRWGNMASPPKTLKRFWISSQHLHSRIVRTWSVWRLNWWLINLVVTQFTWETLWSDTQTSW